MNMLERYIIKELAKKGYVFNSEAERDTFVKEKCKIVKLDNANHLYVNNKEICMWTESDRFVSVNK